MEAIIFVGLQATGKSTYYKNNYFNSHLRISNDLLKTKNRESKLLEFCKDSSMPFVIDNTNITKEVRIKYIKFCKMNNFSITCLYFKTDIKRSLEWNSKRVGKERVPDVGILGTYKKLELPSIDEGFDSIYYVDYIDGSFIVKEWNNEI